MQYNRQNPMASLKPGILLSLSILVPPARLSTTERGETSSWVFQSLSTRCHGHISGDGSTGSQTNNQIASYPPAIGQVQRKSGPLKMLTHHQEHHLRLRLEGKCIHLAVSFVALAQSRPWTLTPFLSFSCESPKDDEINQIDARQWWAYLRKSMGFSKP